MRLDVGERLFLSKRFRALLQAWRKTLRWGRAFSRQAEPCDGFCRIGPFRAACSGKNFQFGTICWIFKILLAKISSSVRFIGSTVFSQSYKGPIIGDNGLYDCMIVENVLKNRTELRIFARRKSNSPKIVPNSNLLPRAGAATHVYREARRARANSTQPSQHLLSVRRTGQGSSAAPRMLRSLRRPLRIITNEPV